MAVKRRKFIRTVSYLVAVSVILAASGYFSQRAKAEYEEILGKVRLTNLTSVCDYARDAASGLRVLAVSSGESVADSMAHVRASAMGAMGCLNSFDQESVENMSKFFAGIYGFAEDFSGSEAERKAAVQLSGYAEGIYYHLNDVASAVIGGAYSLTEHGSPYSGNEKPYFENYLDYSNGNEEEIFALVSPATAKPRESIFLADKAKISQADARAMASRVVGISSALWRICEKQQNGIEVFALRYGDIEIDICKAGGAVCRLINPLPCAEVFYSFEEAEKKAADFFKKQGYYDMVAVSGEQNEFAARFSFAPKTNGILNLTAAAQVSVCLASGGITDFNASEYIKNHRKDLNFSFGNPDLSAFLAPELVLKETLHCFAQVDGRERFVCVAICSFEADEAWIYIDASSFEVLKAEIK
ncbi:MAG: germination protein YpeB [Clostridia bacterium]|nr:germination protein YpeB [Clostridia bacterium]